MIRRLQSEQDNLRIKRALMRQQINQSHRVDREFEIDERFHSVSMYVKHNKVEMDDCGYYDQQIWKRLDRFDQVMPNQRNNCSWVIYEDYLYIFGGFTFNGRLDDVHRYSFSNNQWQHLNTKGQKPSARENNGAIEYKGCMYVFGGCDGLLWLNDFYSLNLKTLQWKKIEPTGQCPSERFGIACGAYQTKMLIFGGCDGTHYLNDAYVWDFEEQVWNKLQLIGDVPSARSCPSFSTFNNQIYIFGGFDGVNRLNDFYKINIFTGKVKRISQHGTIPCPRYFHTSEVYQNKLLLFGGFNGHSRLNDLYEFEFGSKTWKKLEVNEPPKGRSSMVFQLYNDSLYVFGGYDGDELLSDIYKLEFKNAQVPRSSFLQDLRSLINNPQMSDVVFIVEDHQIYANRCILGARSEHFQTLFFEEFRDKDQIYIEITECSYQTFMDMLQYIYTDQLDTYLNTNRLLSLIVLSDHYLMQRLKYLCEEQLIKKINCNNVIELILFSKKYNCRLLRVQTMKQLVDNISTIKKRKDFINLAQEPEILLEIIQKKC
ncbi:unnamed protein product [Paramecium sonneborni]|uniref:BTB domain-containing protein n=1 Tax=Paramecium sonneborni TaxID=65129 RepID=A0A8S1K1B0_9CILI|nr:unnamed protein product [Paramecium sonneborni]